MGQVCVLNLFGKPMLRGAGLTGQRTRRVAPREARKMLEGAVFLSSLGPFDRQRLNRVAEATGVVLPKGGLLTDRFQGGLGLRDALECYGSEVLLIPRVGNPDEGVKPGFFRVDLKFGKRPEVLPSTRRRKPQGGKRRNGWWDGSSQGGTHEAQPERQSGESRQRRKAPSRKSARRRIGRR